MKTFKSNDIIVNQTGNSKPLTSDDPSSFRGEIMAKNDDDIEISQNRSIMLNKMTATVDISLSSTSIDDIKIQEFTRKL